MRQIILIQRYRIRLYLCIRIIWPIMSYLKRIIVEDVKDKLSASGAVLIKGPKSCGKTETAKQFAKSIVEMDRDPQVPVIMATNPQLLLAGNTPRLIDEWQEQPEIWNYVLSLIHI